MKKNYSTLLLLLIFLSITYSIVKPHRIIKNHLKSRGAYTKLYKNQRIWQNLSTEFPILEKKPLVVVITSFNNEAICERNLQSVFSQTYDNYRVIYIDDCSTDKTYETVKHFIKASGKEDVVTLIRNPTRALKLTNLYEAYHSCLDQEIIVCLDGDDHFAHENVLARINQFYQNSDVWLTYGSAIIHPAYEETTGICIKDSTLNSSSIRNAKTFDVSMLRTFYAGLFKKIQLKDLFYQGSFFPSADDVAFMIPMIEMAQKHVLFVPEILYIINDNNPIRENKITGTLQERLRAHIASKEKYAPLPETFDPRNLTTPQMSQPVEVVLSSEDSPMLLLAALESHSKHLIDVEKTTVFYSTSSDDYLEAYQEVLRMFPKVNFIHDKTKDFQGLKTSLEEVNSSPYIVVTSDEFILKDNLSLLEFVKEMEETKARSLYLGHFGGPINGVKIGKEFSALNALHTAKYPDLKTEAVFTLMRKEDVLKTLHSEGFKKKKFMETYLISSLDRDEICLFNEKKKAYPLVLAAAKQTFDKVYLLKKFQQGFRINLASIEGDPSHGLQEKSFVRVELL